MEDDRLYHLTVFGVTGYTGNLVVKYLNQLKKQKRLSEKIMLCFAGRDVKKVKARCEQLCPHLIGSISIVFADVFDEPSIFRMASDSKVVLSCVVSCPPLRFSRRVYVRVCLLFVYLEKLTFHIKKYPKGTIWRIRRSGCESMCFTRHKLCRCNG